MNPRLKAPFPYAGGKSKVAEVVWERIGDVAVYVEPFFGSGAVLFARPHAPRVETVNDADGLLCNAYRAIRLDPEHVAYWADWPVMEADLHARHLQLVAARDGLTAKLCAQPEYFDAELAGKWIYGASCWIGSGWCSGEGPWIAVDGKLVKREDTVTAGVERKRPHLMNEGKGVFAKVPHLGDGGRGIHRQVPQMGDFGRGINAPDGVSRQVPHLGHLGKGVHAPGISRQAPLLRGDSGAAGAGIHGTGVTRQIGQLSGYPGGAGRGIHSGSMVRKTSNAGILAWMEALAARLRNVRIVCGDWSRVVGPAGTVHIGTTGILLDPPYRHTTRDVRMYHHDDSAVWDQARTWAIEHGTDPRIRIALCGYAGPIMPPGWTEYVWKASGGYGSQGNGQGRENCVRERIWFSPHCIRRQLSLFDAQEVVS